MALPASKMGIPKYMLDEDTQLIRVNESKGLTATEDGYEIKIGSGLSFDSNGKLKATGGGGGAVDSVNGQTGDVILTASDVGALPDDTVIPTKTSDLTNDSGFITSGDIPTIPTKVSELTNDTGYLTIDTLPKYNGEVSD